MKSPEASGPVHATVKVAPTSTFSGALRVTGIGATTGFGAGSTGFGAAGVGMVVGLVIYWLGSGLVPKSASAQPANSAARAAETNADHAD